MFAELPDFVDMPMKNFSSGMVERICQRAVWIEKGDLRMDGPVDEVCKAYRAQVRIIATFAKSRRRVFWQIS